MLEGFESESGTDSSEDEEIQERRTVSQVYTHQCVALSVDMYFRDSLRYIPGILTRRTV